MRRRDFFINAINAGCYKRKSWIFKAFSVVSSEKTSTDLEPWDIQYIAQDHPGEFVVRFFDGESNEIDIEDYQFDPDKLLAPFSFYEKLEIKKGELINVDRDLTTTYGNVLANALLLIYPFADKVAFINKRFHVKDVEKIIEKSLTDDSNPQDPSLITIEENNRFREAASLIDGLTQLCVPSATAKSLTTHPKMQKLRKELLESQDDLDDPATIAAIESELQALDKEHLSGDESENFFIVSGKIDIARKRMHVMLGREGAGGKDAREDFLPYALSEGWDPKDMPALASSVREGSFDRSVMTAVGGEAAKFIIRTMQNNRIEEDDCQTPVGVLARVDKSNRDQMLYNYIITDSATVQLTDENIDTYMNKTVRMRSPLFCRSEGRGFCKTCIGGRYADHPTGIAIAASEIGNIIMDIFMQSAHARALEVVDYQFEQSLS